MTEQIADVWRSFREKLSILTFVLYLVFAIAPSIVLARELFLASGDVLSTYARPLIYTAVADVAFTVGLVFAIRSRRTEDRGASWKRLGWTGLAFVIGIGLLVLNAATMSAK